MSFQLFLALMKMYTDIVLNLKGVVTKLHKSGPVRAKIQVEGPCVVTAGNIRNPG